MNDIKLVEKTAKMRELVHREIGKRIIGQNFRFAHYFFLDTNSYSDASFGYPPT